MIEDVVDDDRSRRGASELKINIPQRPSVGMVDRVVDTWFPDGPLSRRRSCTCEMPLAWLL